MKMNTIVACGAVIACCISTACSSPEEKPGRTFKPTTASELGPLDRLQVLERFVKQLDAERVKWSPDGAEARVQIGRLESAEGLKGLGGLRSDLKHELFQLPGIAVYGDSSVAGEVGPYEDPAPEFQRPTLTHEVRGKLFAGEQGLAQLELSFVDLESGEALVRVVGP